MVLPLSSSSNGMMYGRIAGVVMLALLVVSIVRLICSDYPTRIYTLRKYVRQAEDRTSVEAVRAKQ